MRSQIGHANAFWHRTLNHVPWILEDDSADYTVLEIILPTSQKRQNRPGQCTPLVPTTTLPMRFDARGDVSATTTCVEPVVEVRPSVTVQVKKPLLNLTVYFSKTTRGAEAAMLIPLIS